MVLANSIANSNLILMRRWAPLLCFMIGPVVACDPPRPTTGDTARQQAKHEIIQFTNGEVTLEGLLDVPIDKQPRPLVVFVHGSGKATRQDYLSLALKLNWAGYATFRYDKRGVGESGGTFQELGSWNSVERVRLLAEDAAAAIRHLSKREDIDNKKIIVMGGSQAGWIIPVVCGLVDVSMTVCVSGPCISIGEEMYYSDLAETGDHSQAEADKMLSSFQGERGFDNARHVGSMTKPSLWIFGGKDVSIPVARCIARLDSIKAASRLPLDLKIYPDADHGMFNKTSGRTEAFETVIIEWLGAHL
jgi:dienelactone hydrolase